MALDGKSYEVDADMCVIADDADVLGLGGVIGGEETGVTEATTNVFIESAYFDPKRTARTGRKLGIQSDARFRFERGVDPDFVVPGLELATRDGARLCGGEPSKITIAGKPPKAEPAVQIRSRPGRAPERARARASATSRSCSPRSASSSTARASSVKARRRPGALTSPAPPIWSRRWCGSTGVDQVPATPMTARGRRGEARC